MSIIPKFENKMTEKELKTLKTGTLILVKSKNIVGTLMGYSKANDQLIFAFIEIPLGVETAGVGDVEVVKEIPPPCLMVGCVHGKSVADVECKKCEKHFVVNGKHYCID